LERKGAVKIGIRKAALEEMRWAVEVFAELRASKMTVHPDRSIAFVIGSKGVRQKNLQSFVEIELVARPSMAV
jgi:hypothetical protein